jgi:hypothetical protein
LWITKIHEARVEQLAIATSNSISYHLKGRYKLGWNPEVHESPAGHEGRIELSHEKLVVKGCCRSLSREAAEPEGSHDDTARE